METSDWVLLQNALRQPLSTLTAVEIDTVAHARDCILSLKPGLGYRPNAILRLIARDPGADLLLDFAKKLVKGWPEGQGVLFVTDETLAQTSGALDFWRTMNLQREAWAGLGCHVVFFLFPTNYKLFLTVADHLADWVPLKLHLIEKHATTDQIEGGGSEPSSYPSSPTPSPEPESQREFLCRMEVSLAAELAAGETSPAALTRRFYLPMLEAAYDLHDLHRARALLARIDESSIRNADMPQFLRLKFYVSLDSGRLEEAESIAQRLVEWSQKAQDKALESQALHCRGRVAQARRDFNSAEAWYCKSLAIAEHLDNEGGVASTYNQLGIISQARRDFNAAEGWYGKSLAAAEQQGNELAAASTYHNLGIIAEARRDFNAAEAWYRKSLAIAERLGDELHEAATSYQLGRVAQERGDLNAAEACYRKSLEIAERLGDEMGAAANYHHLGLTAQARREFTAADTWYRKSLAIAERLGDELGAALTYHQLGRIAQERHDFKAAEALYHKSMQIKERLGYDQGTASTYHQLGRIAHERGEFEAAEQWYRKALMMKQSLGDEHFAASTYGQMGLLYKDRGLYLDSARWLLKCIRAFHDTHDGNGVVGGVSNMLELYKETTVAEKEQIRGLVKDAGLSDLVDFEQDK